MKARYFTALLLIIILWYSCSPTLYIRQHDDNNYSVHAGQNVDSSIYYFLQPYKKGVDTQMEVIIGRTDIMLTKAQPESSLGNFIADAQLVAAKKIDKDVEVSILNYGGIRLPYIQAGNITRGMMYELMPFDNLINIVEMPGRVLKQFCDHIAKYKGWPVAGMSFVIDGKKAKDIRVGGKPVNDHIIYMVAVNDYLIKGGDNCDFLISLKKKNTHIFIRDAMIDYVINLEKNNQPLHPQLENRIVYATE